MNLPWTLRRIWARLFAGIAAPALLSLGAAVIADTPPPVETKQQETRAAPALDVITFRQIALDKQPALAAYRASVEAAEAKARGLDALVLPAVIRRDLSLRRQQSQLGILAARAQLIKTEWDTVYAVTRTYYSAVYARQQLQVANRNLDPKAQSGLAYLRDIAKKIVDERTRRDVKRWDVGRLNAMLQVAEGRREEALEGVERAKAGLREAVGLEVCAAVELKDVELPALVQVPDRCAVVSLAVDRRGEVMQARVGAEVTCLEVAAQQLILGPSAETFASASDLHALPIPQGLANGEYRPGAVSIEMPHTLVGPKSARVQQAEALHGRALAVVDKTRHLVALDAEDAYLKWREASRKADAYRKAAKTAQQTADDVSANFNIVLRPNTPPEPTLDDLVEARLRSVQLELLANQAHFEALLALIALERVTAGGVCPGFLHPGPQR